MADGGCTLQRSRSSLTDGNGFLILSAAARAPPANGFAKGSFSTASLVSRVTEIFYNAANVPLCLDLRHLGSFRVAPPMLIR